MFSKATPCFNLQNPNNLLEKRNCSTDDSKSEKGNSSLVKKNCCLIRRPFLVRQFAVKPPCCCLRMLPLSFFRVRRLRYATLYNPES